MKVIKYDKVQVAADSVFDTALRKSQAAINAENAQLYESAAASGAAVSFRAASAGLPLKKLAVRLVPARTGSGVISPVNERPLIGYTGVTLTQSGKNLLDACAPETVSGVMIGSDGRLIENNAYACTETYIEVRGGTEYALQYVKNGNFEAGAYAAVYDSGRHFLERVPVAAAVSRSGRITGGMTAPPGAAYIRLVFPSGSTGLQLEEGPAATEYVSERHDCPFSWESLAGTVYGGELDVLSGTLTVTWTAVDMGTIHYFAYSSVENAFTFNTPGRSLRENERASILADCYGQQVVTFDGISNNCIAAGIANATGILRDSRFSTPAEVKEGLSGKLLYYPLAEPAVFQLTPQELRTLAGVNRIRADCGEVSAVCGAYLETVQSRAEGLVRGILGAVAPTEGDWTASRNYEAGAFLFVGTGFYKTTEAIASGGVIMPGVNVSRTTVAEELTALMQA